MKVAQLFKRSLVVIAISAGMVLPAHSAKCPIIIPSAPILTPLFSKQGVAIDKSFETTNKAIASSIARRNMLIQQAFKVYNLQTVATTEELSINMAKNAQTQLEIQEALKQAVAMAEVSAEYSSRGLGYNLCHVYAKQSQVQEKSTHVSESVKEMTRNEVSARAGRYFPRTNAMATRLATHNALYCTKDQADSGLCVAEARRAGKNLEAGVLFTKAKAGSDEYNDKSAFIDNIIGFPDDAPPAHHKDSLLGIAYQDMKRRKDAGRSIASYSLKTLQARYSEVDHVHSHDDGHSHNHNDTAQSEEARLLQAKNAGKATANSDMTAESQNKDNGALMPMLVAEQSRYFGGGGDYKEWSKYLVGATEKGVMQEIIKVEALNLKLIHEQTKINRLISTNLSALLSAELYNTGAESDVEALRNRIATYTIAKQGENNQ